MRRNPTAQEIVHDASLVIAVVGGDVRVVKFRYGLAIDEPVAPHEALGLIELAVFRGCNPKGGAKKKKKSKKVTRRKKSTRVDPGAMRAAARIEFPEGEP